MTDIFTPPPKEKEEESGTTQTKATVQFGKPKVQLSSSLPHPDIVRSPGLFSSYTPNPIGIHFLNQEDDETMLLFLRKHFITNVPWILFTVFLIVLLPLYFFVLHVTNFIFFPVPPAFTFVSIIFYYLFVASYALGRFVVWFYHVGIVTNKRLLDLDLDNILHFDMAEAKINEIVDVSYLQKGFFQSYFDYGDVKLQTEALEAHFSFELTPHPARVADIITDLQPEKRQH